MMNVAVLFLNGGCASTATLPTEIFCNAGVFWNLVSGEPPRPRFRVTTASLDGEPVRTDRLISLRPERSFRDIASPHLVFVPAGGLELEALAQNGYDIDAVIDRNVETVGWLKRWAEDGAQIAAVCSGVALVAEAGLLDGKPATAHWGLVEQYARRFPRVDWRPEYLVTDAGRFYCGGGINSAADLALYLVEKFCGRETATRCAKALLIEMPRTWQNAFTHFSMRPPHDDERIHRAQGWLQKNYSQVVRIETLAAELGMSARNFIRRFKQATGETPMGYLQSLRIAMAKRLLENGRLTIQEVAQEVGYADLIFFRALFKRHTGTCPNDYRKRFGGQGPQPVV
ncbi:GlxA family transcriptional regulator [Amphiplicatus metriothermophilus]|uniref:Transcriptional regulator, AraC family with amidase-like domain n=1 Tax=Amphiplicatus metriothermophilus TaxID=1519374 RepID=A0A239PT00_9PROT|nr:helix-turn-helix domain-containing protein [Amphiplicatus metriothermophilus]MBB5519330.1 transcriptional regulator GlxA family with amidase domain [Amphiplicatus metriothermophilus]SNT73411.1 transcriptional regulator, AraC family with amidase-like domain [Amphiplicatus metriothermophilus]